MSDLWQIASEKLVAHSGAFYFYTNCYYCSAANTDEALSIGLRVQQAELALLLNDSTQARTYALGVRSPGRLSGWDLVYHNALLGLREWDGTPVMPAWVVARVTFPTGGRFDGRKWYRCAITELEWSSGGMSSNWQAAYGAYVAALEAVRPQLRLPNGAVLPPPAPNAILTGYALRHGTKRRQRPVIG